MQDLVRLRRFRGLSGSLLFKHGIRVLFIYTDVNIVIAYSLIG